MANAKEFSLEDIDAIILKDDAEKLVQVSRILGEDLARSRLATHQLRNLFGEVRRIAMDLELELARQGEQKRISPTLRRRILLLKPRMAYQAARIQTRETAMERLKQVLERAIDHIGDNPDRFQRFVDFFEAIVAYHRYYLKES